MSDQQIPEDVQKLILALSRKAREVQKEDASLLSSERLKSRVSTFKEILAVLVIGVGLIGYVFTLKTDVTYSTQKIRELEARLIDVQKDIQALEIKFAGMKQNP